MSVIPREPPNADKSIISSVEAAEPRRGASILPEILHSEGVKFIFGNPGTTELPLMDALIQTPDIRYILALQEASAVAMAEATHKPRVGQAS
jgi:benzoylformate decarboxylase